MIYKYIFYFFQVDLFFIVYIKVLLVLSKYLLNKIKILISKKVDLINK